MATTHKNTSMTLNWNCISRIQTERTNGTIWYRGAVITPNGIVNVLFSEPKGTLLEFAHDGRLYDRRWRRQFQPRYLVSLARKFADDVTGADNATE